MKILLASIVLAISFSASAIRYEGESFVFSRKGKDKAGVSLDERLHIRADSSVLWTTVSRGAVDCPREAGTFMGKVSEDDFKKIVNMGINEIEQQKKLRKKTAKQERAFTRRNTVSSITIWSQGKDYYGLVNDWTKGVMSIDTEMAKIMGKTKPVKAIRMEAEVAGNRVKVIFKNIGKEPFDIVLPEDPQNAFDAGEGVKISYVKHPKQLRRTLLKGAKLEKELKLSSLAKTLYYRNHLIKHHSASYETMEVAICAPLKK